MDVRILHGGSDISDVTIRYDRNSAGQFITNTTNLLEKRFERLLVIGRGELDYRRRRNWICICDCGNYHITSTESLNGGHVRSCGCLLVDTAREKGIKHRTSVGSAALNLLYSGYIKNSEKRNKSFSLTKEEFKLLVSGNCRYCGAAPSNVKSHKRIYGSFTYNGVDRVDNLKGYTIDNCVPCCTTCNKAKLTMTEKEFFDWITKVYEHCCKT